IITYGQGPEVLFPFFPGGHQSLMAGDDHIPDIGKIHALAPMDHGQGIIGHGHFPMGKAQGLEGIHKIKDFSQNGPIDLGGPLDQYGRIAKRFDGDGESFHFVGCTWLLGNSRERYINISETRGLSPCTQRVSARSLRIPPPTVLTRPSRIMGSTWSNTFFGSPIKASLSPRGTRPKLEL